MATGTTLEQLISQLRAEIGASPSSSQGVNALQMYARLLQRTQETLYDDFDWPQLVIERDEPMNAGERYYTFDPDINFNRIQNAKVKYAGCWQPVRYGFDSAIYNAADSDLDVRQNPVVAWRHYEGNQFEVWPIPADNSQVLRFRSIKQLAPLVKNSDTADLDDIMVVLFAAAELLARMKSEDAGTKLKMAQARYNRLRSRTMKSGTIIMGGGVPSLGTPERMMWGAPIVDGNPNPV